MENIEQDKIPQSVHNHLNYIRDNNSKIRFLELFFNFKLRWYQRWYLKAYLLFQPSECKQFQRFFQFTKTKKR